MSESNESNETVAASKAKAPRKRATAKATEIREQVAGDPLLVMNRTLADDGAEPEVAREAQFPARFDGSEKVEVAQRSVDVDHLGDDALATTGTHRKVFVLLRREWDTHTDDEKQAVHDRNIRQVRQFMVSNGLRPDAEVKFAGEEVVEVPQTGRFSNDSVRLAYTVSAVPTSVTGADDGESTDIELVHTVVPQDGASAQEQADYEAGTYDRVAAGRSARVGDVPGPKPSRTATA